MPDFVVLADAEQLYLRLADERQKQGHIAMAEFLRMYASVASDNVAHLGLAGSQTRTAAPSLYLPTESRPFTAGAIDKGVRAVLFDMYMTLVDLRLPRLLHVVLADALNVHPDQTAAAYKHFAHQFLVGAVTPFDRMRGIAELAGRPSISDNDIHRLMVMELETNIAATRLFPGVKATIASYRRQGYLVGIVSNANPWGIEVARHHGLIDMVDVAGFSADPAIATQKPFPAIYESVCAGLGVSPSVCLFVDDGGRDFAIEGAQMLGMTTLRVDNPGVERYRPLVPLSHFHTSRIADLKL